MLLIVGVGRSGTSLLQSMLNAHSEICFLPETQFLRNHVINRSQNTINNTAERDRFIQELRADQSYKRSEIAPEAVVEVGDSYAAVYHKFLNAFRENKGKKLVGDKDPRVIDFIAKLRNLNDSPRLIHIMRDPRAVVASRMKADWSKHWPFFMHIFLYRAQFERGRRKGKSLFGNSYHELYYEDLISDPSQQLRKICDFLQVLFEPAMLEFQSSAKELIDKREYQWKKETTGPLLSSNANKWKENLTNDQVFMIEYLCSGIFRSHTFTKSTGQKADLKTRLKSWGLRPFAWLFVMLYPLRSLLNR